MSTKRNMRKLDARCEDDDYHSKHYQTPYDYLDYHQASAKPYPQEGLEGELASNYGDAPSAYLGS